MKYKISIILPVFNVEEFIKEALNSILNQSIGHENLEVIMVDDYSTDSSGKIIDEYSNKYDNFKAIHLPENSGGCGKPRNIGMANSTAPYIMFLDPDDYYLEDACKTLYNAAISGKVDIVFGKYFANYGDFKQSIKTLFDESNQVTISNIHEQPNLMTIPPSVWTKIYKRDFIEKTKIKFVEEFPGEDLVFVTHSFLKANGITFLNKEILSYRIRNNANKSMTFNINKDYIFGLLESYNMVFSICNENNGKDLLGIILENHLGFWLKQLILSNLTNSEKKEALILSTGLFKKYIDLNNKIDQKHLEPIFSNIKDQNYENAIIFINSLQDLLKNSVQMEEHILERDTHIKNQENQIKILNNKLKDNKKHFDSENRLLTNKIKKKQEQIAKLQTVKGYLNYKIRNIYLRARKSIERI